MLFGYFLHDAKSDDPSPSQGDSRFCKPRISPPKQKLPTNKIKTFPKGESRFFKPQFSSPQWRLRTDKIKSFRRLLAALFLLLSQQIFAASRLLSAAAPPFKLSFRKVCRGSANLDSAHTDDSEPHKNSKNSY